MSQTALSTRTPTAAKLPPPGRKRSRTKWFVLAGVLLLATLATAAILSRKGKDEGIAITTEKAVIKTITQLVTATGKVQPETEVKISPEVAGEIIEIAVAEGQKVKKGDLLVKIKSDFYAAQLDQQEAALASAKAASVLSRARMLKAEQDFKQAEELYKKQLVSESDFVTASTNLEVAKADYESSLAQIRRTEGSVSQARDQLSKTVIYSPMDGSISSLTSEVGERVVGTGTYAGTEIMRIADLANMEVRVKVNENDIINVKVGDRSVITIDAFPGRKFSGQVMEIGSSAQGLTGPQQQQQTLSDEVANFLVKIRVSDRDVMLRPGMSATADIETQTVENVVAVPIQSVTVRAEGGKTSEEFQQQKAKEAREKSGNELDLVSEREDARRNRDRLKRVVFVKTGDTVKMVPVETGIADTTHIEVKTGLKVGDEVVSGTYAAISRSLKDGAKVRIDKPKSDAKK